MKHLHPRNEELLRISDDKLDSSESDDEYIKRLRILLPNFPPQVISDWIVCHGSSAFKEHGWFDFRLFRFELSKRPTHFFLNDVLTSNEPAIQDWALAIKTNRQFQEYNLGSYMITNGTWPVPPLVLDNPTDLIDPRGDTLGRYHLLEGHHRLAYLKGLAMEPATANRREHSVWWVTYP